MTPSTPENMDLSPPEGPVAGEGNHQIAKPPIRQFPEARLASPPTHQITHRCLNHPIREAVARCSACSRGYCRECIAEHDDRLLCAACLCLASQALAPAMPSRWPRRIGSVFATLAGATFAWFCFYSLGQILVSIPSQYHADRMMDFLQLEDPAESDE